MGNLSSVDQIVKIKSILYLSLLQLILTKLSLPWGKIQFWTFWGFSVKQNFLFSFACKQKKKCIRKFFCFFFGCRKEFCLVIIRLIVKCKTFKRGPLTRVYPELCDLLDNVAEVLQRQIIQDPTILDKEVSSLNFRIHFFAHLFFVLFFCALFFLHFICYALIFRVNFLHSFFAN